MTNVTFAQVADALATTLASADAALRAEYGESLTESIPDLPLLQVYVEREDTDPVGQNDRTTFKAGVRVSHQTYHADVYTSQRSNIGEDIARCTDLAEAVRAILARQNTQPYFGLDGIKAYKWEMERVTFEYGAVKYAGLRFLIQIWIF